jgi:putative restriction endonuclease
MPNQLRLICVGLTEDKWYEFLSHETGVDEVNFWRPSPRSGVAQLHTGDLFLFKLHAPENKVVGGGYFTKYLPLSISYAWSAFGRKNGADSLESLRARVTRFRADAGQLRGIDFEIGCVMLASPFFLDKRDWFTPPGWGHGIRSIKYYDTNTGDGMSLWNLVHERLAGKQLEELVAMREGVVDPQLVWARTRPGQGIFRSVVADAYDWRCAVTGERVRPVLEAAHIQPYAKDGPNVPQNGLLLRADLHRLLDDGYAMLTSDLCFEVSPRVRAEFQNGRDYYALDHKEIRKPADRSLWPSTEFIKWHRDYCLNGQAALER